MQSTIKIGIVEDELIIAEKIKKLLLGMGYEVCEPVSNYTEALQMIKEEKPDLLLLDINLNDTKDGIDLAQTVNEVFQLPFIFLTANSDSATIERAKKVKPNAYLLKPFSKDELYAAIEIVFNNFKSNAPVEITTKQHTQKDFIFIKENNRFVKVQFLEIIYIESCENYVVVHTKDKKSNIVRSTFTDFIAQLPQAAFIRVHRGFAVQLSFVDRVEPTEISAHGYKIPVSNTYKADLFTKLGIKG